MSVRKREWITASGDKKSGWVADYRDVKGTRRLKTFDKKKDADSFAVTAGVEVREGVHVADSASVTVSTAASFWVVTGKVSGLERSTIAQRQRHIDHHIEPLIGQTLLSHLNVPGIRSFEDRLRSEGRSAAMVKKVLVSLGGILADAQERGLATRNPVRDMRRNRNGKERQAEKRQKRKLRVGVDIPTREEAKAMIAAANGRWRPFVITLIFTGMRSSELRGLRWEDLSVEKREINVTQRADEFNEIGRPKSESGERSIPVPPIVINTLKEWRLACPRRATPEMDADGKPVKELHYVFPNGKGHIESYSNIVKRGLQPLQIEAGITKPKLDKGGTPIRDKDGNQVMSAKYNGLHAFRHFFASWLINSKSDGGLGLLPKTVQERMGHSSIIQTMDTYGHLFPRGDDADELATAEAAMLK
ncbi:tyrosine-type recombinase/integrase [Mesorhizobium sp. IMUNJ 23232]|uniref:tyrosine-type recombinase/integrase n=1 Tax=Mesorhizobium sp. IMUNJ 23232 TaxID=3376064 RepID=UPI00379F4059